MRTLLICHDGAALTREGIGRWLASFSDLVGVMVLHETRGRMWRRVRREIRRVEPLRFLDVLAFRAYRALVLARREREWTREKLDELRLRYPPVPRKIPVLHTHSPNTPEAERFVRECAPDIMIARCKTLLAERVFSIPADGTFVFHPGICPEYRNAHGCFWALVNDDHARVGMTLLRIDRGVDTGPVYGYYSYPYDEVGESPAIIHHRVVVENLDRLQSKLVEIHRRTAVPLDTSGRLSRTWGQPWLSRYLAWKWKARKRANERAHSTVS